MHVPKFAKEGVMTPVEVSNEEPRSSRNLQKDRFDSCPDSFRRASTSAKHHGKPPKEAHLRILEAYLVKRLKHILKGLAKAAFPSQLCTLTMLPKAEMVLNPLNQAKSRSIRYFTNEFRNHFARDKVYVMNFDSRATQRLKDRAIGKTTEQYFVQ